MSQDSLSITAPRQLEARVWQAVDTGQPREAIALCRQLNQQYPDFAAGWRTTSHLAERGGNHPAALEAIEQAVRLEPANEEWLLQKAACLMRLGRYDGASPLLDLLAPRQMTSAYRSSTLGLLLSRQDRHREALIHYRRAAALEPRESQHPYNIASVLRFLGETEAAEAAVQQAIDLGEPSGEAYKLRSDLRLQTPERNNIVQLRAELARCAAPRREIQLRFALAKELEDTHSWAESFEQLSRGAARRRSLIRYDVQGDLDTMRAIAEHYDAQTCDNVAQGTADQPRPIFILGMPRTGSTLVERILGRHSKVRSAGELNDFALQMTAQVRRHLQSVQPAPTRAPSKVQMVAYSKEIDFAALGEAYLQGTEGRRQGQTFFIDKMPLNFLYVGLILRALPQARIIHLRRDPMDSCYAIFKTLFTDAYPFSYDLGELAHYYAGYQTLMQHWQAVLPGRILDVYYEDVVNDLEAQTRRLLDHCELPFDPQCLEFQHNPDASTTASASQVRQGLYSSSVGKWRHFATQLETLRDALLKAGAQLA